MPLPGSAAANAASAPHGISPPVRGSAAGTSVALPGCASALLPYAGSSTAAAAGLTVTRSAVG